MKIKSNLILLFLSLTINAESNLIEEKEKLYFELYDQALTGKMSYLQSFSTNSVQNKVQVDVWWDISFDLDSQNQTPKIRNAIKRIIPSQFETTELVRLLAIGDKIKIDSSIQKKILRQLKIRMKSNLNTASIYQILNHEKLLLNLGLNREIESIKIKFPLSVKNFNEITGSAKTALPKDSIKDLYFGVEVENRSTLIVFCRENRQYPCLMLLKDSDGNPVYSGDDLWHLPTLGMSKLGFSFSKNSGDTPSGIYQLDGVMPLADRQQSFGKNRRLIMTIPKSSEQTKELIPKSALLSRWWEQNFLAKTIGRDYLRIHGTGLINLDPLSLYYPFVPSHGCLKVREGLYNNTLYNDARVLLDTLMKAQDLPVSYNSETLIRSTLVVIEIDQQMKPVDLEEVKSLLH